MGLVWRDYDQATLDFECNPARGVADDRSYLETYARLSREAREALGGHFGLRYGASAAQELDVFPASEALSPVMVFIHGGGWRSLSKDDAELRRCGACAAQHDGGLRRPFTDPGRCPLPDIVADARAALAWVWQRAEDFNGDRDRIYVGGHSAGAHLAAMLLAEGWHQPFGLPGRIVRGAILISGNYNLEPLRLSYRNAWLKLDPSTALDNSPLHRVPPEGPPILVAWGARESRQYKMQGREFAERWRSRAGSAEEIELEGLNHFETVLQLGEGGVLAERVCRLVAGEGR